MNLFLGCPIWAFKGWIGNFYPKGTKSPDYLREYSRRLNTVEGNTTFYAVPAPETVMKWVEDTPPSFQLCPKIPKAISHSGKVSEHIPETLEFLGVMSQLGSRLGPTFLQLPPSYSPGMTDDLQAFLEAWPPEARLAVEVRHTYWFDSPHYESLTNLLSKYQAARVVIDTRPIRTLKGDSILEGSVYLRLLQARERKPNLPIIPELTSNFVFLRFIGHPQMEQNLPVIEEWTEHLAGWLQEGAQVYVFCHCPDERQDPLIARQFHRRIAARISVPPLPWDEIEPDVSGPAKLF